MQRAAIRAVSIVVCTAQLERAREMLRMGVLICGLACGTETLADERDRSELPIKPAHDARLSQLAPLVEPAYQPHLSGVLAPQFDVGALSLLDPAPSAQFSPRKYRGPDPSLEPLPEGAQSLRTTTVWQRLNEYRSKDRVRLVTLWETAGSSVSLQAGRHGEPSLQWTSRALNRGGATRGLLDHLVAASLGAAGVALTQPGNPRTVGAFGAGAARVDRPSLLILTSHAP